MKHIHLLSLTLFLSCCTLPDSIVTHAVSKSDASVIVLNVLQKYPDTQPVFEALLVALENDLPITAESLQVSEDTNVTLALAALGEIAALYGKDNPNTAELAASAILTGLALASPSSQK